MRVLRLALSQEDCGSKKDSSRSHARSWSMSCPQLWQPAPDLGTCAHYTIGKEIGYLALDRGCPFGLRAVVRISAPRGWQLQFWEAALLLVLALVVGYISCASGGTLHSHPSLGISRMRQLGTQRQYLSWRTSVQLPQCLASRRRLWMSTWRWRQRFTQHLHVCLSYVFLAPILRSTVVENMALAPRCLTSPLRPSLSTWRLRQMYAEIDETLAVLVHTSRGCGLCFQPDSGSPLHEKGFAVRWNRSCTFSPTSEMPQVA